MKRQTRAYICVLIAVLCWSTVATAFKLTLRRLDPVSMLFYSSMFAALFFLVASALQRNRRPVDPIRDFRTAIVPSAINGFLNPFLYYMVLFKAYSLLPAQEAQPLNYTWPIMIVLLAAPLLGQQVRPIDLAGLAVSFLGVLVISTRGKLLGFHFTNLPGAMLAIGSSVIWALYWIRNIRDERKAVSKMFLNFFFGFLYISIYLAVRHGRAIYDGQGIGGALYIGLFEMAIPFLFWLKALDLSESPARVGNLVFLSPFISLIFIRALVGEEILPSSFAGLVLIVAGIFVQKLKRAPRDSGGAQIA